MGLMGALYVGTSGLQTSQNALNTTAHNMSNVDTAGYTRQQVQLGTRYYNTISKTGSANAYQQIGLGVNYSNVKQVRDYFLDKTYRREAGRGAFYDTSVEAVEEVEDLFQELQGETFSESLDNLWVSVQELAKDPSSAVNQGVFVQRCYEFIERAGAVYQGLCEYQDNINYKVKEQVETINKYGERIKELNDEILMIESAKFEKANDLRDERNHLIDELAKMGYISVDEDAEGYITIQFEGNDFVKDDTVNRIDVKADELTGFYTPYWEKFAEKTLNPDGTVKIDIGGAEVYNMQQVISTDMNTDIGALKAMLFARGTRRATYEDLANEQHYVTNISQSVIMNVQAEFDQLVNKIVNAINGVLEESAKAAETANPDSTYLKDAEGNIFQIFNTITNETDKEGKPYFTVENIIINGELKQAPSLLGFIKEDGKVDQETADKLKELFTKEEHTLNPQVKTKTNFLNYYNNLISQVANTGSVMKGISENQQITVDSTAAAREQILGVSSDEEMSNMIMFQNAFNASSRYINAVSEMLEHIIRTLGM